MRKTILVLLMLAAAITGCKKENLTVSFDLDQRDAFTMPATAGILDLLRIITPEKSYGWDQTFANNNTERNRLEDMRLRKFTLTIKNPVGKSFRFLKSIEVFLQADGLQEVMIGEKQNIPNEVGNLLELDVPDINLSEYAKRDKFKLRVSYVQDEATFEDYDIESYLLFKAKARIIE